MKKSKLLAPLLGLASIGAIAAPTIASCGGSSSSTISVAMSKVMTNSYTSPTSLYSVTSGKTYSYTGVTAENSLIGGSLPTTIAITTVSGSSVTGLSITSVKVNGTALSAVATQYTYTLPSGITAGSSLKIEVVYSTTASNCLTSIVLA